MITMTGYAPKLATATIDLKEFGGEGTITVKALSTQATLEIAKITEQYGEDSIVAGIETAMYICRNCIVESPFEINDKVIKEFPPDLTTEISKVVFGLQKDIPLT